MENAGEITDMSKEEGELSDDDESGSLNDLKFHEDLECARSKSRTRSSKSIKNQRLGIVIPPHQRGSSIAGKDYDYGHALSRPLNPQASREYDAYQYRLPSPPYRERVGSRHRSPSSPDYRRERDRLPHWTNREQFPQHRRLWEKRRLRSTSQKDKKPEENDPNFEELLDTYKAIQDKLASFKQEEEKLDEGSQETSSKDLSDKENQLTNIATVLSDSNPETEIVEKQSDEPTSISDVSSVVDLPHSGGEKTQNSIEINDEDDDDLDELELRRIALASAAEKSKEAELMADKKWKNDKRSEELRQSTVKTGSKKSQQLKGKEAVKKTSKNTVRHSPQKNKSATNVSQSQRKNLAHKKVGHYRSTRGYRRRTNSLEKRREDERRQQEEKRKREENQKREINKILTLDDPEEQVSRFLRLIRDKEQSYENRMGKVPPRPQMGGDRKSTPRLPHLQDNYDEVVLFFH